MLIKFQNSVGVERIIGEGDTKEKCNQIIQKFLKDRGYKSYYWNIYKINGFSVLVNTYTYRLYNYII